MRSPEVCALTGATYRQLDHWTRLGYVIPSITDQNGALAGDSGTGYPREFTHGDLLHVAVMAQLTGIGVSPAVAAKLADHARTTGQRFVLRVGGALVASDTGDVPFTAAIAVDVHRIRAELATRIEAAA